MVKIHHIHMEGDNYVGFRTRKHLYLWRSSITIMPWTHLC